jgi:biopolymer transport protein ExbD
MHFKRRYKFQGGLEQIDIVPFMNIVFLIVLFFVVTTLLASESGIHVRLPKAVTSDVLREGNIVIAITSENVIYLNGHITTIKELTESLQSLPKDRSILIKADRRSSVGRIVDVWNLSRSLGIEQVNIATNQSH